MASDLCKMDTSISTEATGPIGENRTELPRPEVKITGLTNHRSHYFQTPEIKFAHLVQGGDRILAQPNKPAKPVDQI